MATYENNFYEGYGALVEHMVKADLRGYSSIKGCIFRDKKANEDAFEELRYNIKKSKRELKQGGGW